MDPYCHGARLALAAFVACLFIPAAVAEQVPMSATDLGTNWIIDQQESAWFPPDLNNRGEVLARRADFQFVLWRRGLGEVVVPTLGGSPTAATAMNDQGQITGFGFTAAEEQHAILWSLGKEIRDLGVLEPGGVSDAKALNAAGEVIGQASTAESLHAYFWDRERGMRILGHLGGITCDPIALNDSRQVVGHSNTLESDLHAFLWSEREGMLDLGTLGGITSIAYDVNNAGHVVGWADVSSGEMHAFLWTPRHGMQDLGALFLGSFAIAINEFDEIVGSTYVALPGSDGTAYAIVAFRWTAEEGMRSLGTLAGNPPYVESFSEIGCCGLIGAPKINALGQTAGVSGLGSPGGTSTFHAFLWTPEFGMQDLGTPLGGNQSGAWGLNDLGQVIGWSTDAEGIFHAVLWSPPFEVQLRSLHAVLSRLASNSVKTAQLGVLNGFLDAAQGLLAGGDAEAAARRLRTFAEVVEGFARGSLVEFPVAQKLAAMAIGLSDQLVPPSPPAAP